MKQKRKSPAILDGSTGNNKTKVNNPKDTKKTRIKRKELLYSWQPPVNVKCMGRNEL